MPNARCRETAVTPDELDAIKAAIELDFRDAMQATNPAELRLIVGVLCGRTTALLAALADAQAEVQRLRDQDGQYAWAGNQAEDRAEEAEREVQRLREQGEWQWGVRYDNDSRHDFWPETGGKRRALDAAAIFNTAEKTRRATLVRRRVGPVETVGDSDG